MRKAIGKRCNERVTEQDGMRARTRKRVGWRGWKKEKDGRTFKRAR